VDPLDIATHIVVAGATGAGDTVSSIEANANQITLIVLGLLGTTIATLAWVIKNGARVKEVSENAAVAAVQSAAANKAVNNVGPGDHSLYDMVSGIKETLHIVQDDLTEVKADQKRWAAHGWETLPPDMNTAVALTQTIRDLQNGHVAVHEKLDTITLELRSAIARQDAARNN
jgi:hypothetical protein